LLFVADSKLCDVSALCVQGESIGKTEATEAFFAMTKLFQSRDVSQIFE